MINNRHLINSILSMHAGAPINVEVLESLQSGFKRYLYENMTLDEAFYFKQTRIRADSLLDERNRYLKIAAKYYIKHTSPSDLAHKLEKEIIKFETTQWQQWKHLETPPEGCSLLRWHLFFAKKTGQNMPGFRQIMRKVL